MQPCVALQCRIFVQHHSYIHLIIIPGCSPVKFSPNRPSTYCLTVQNHGLNHDPFPVLSAGDSISEGEFYVTLEEQSLVEECYRQLVTQYNEAQENKKKGMVSLCSLEISK